MRPAITLGPLSLSLGTSEAKRLAEEFRAEQPSVERCNLRYICERLRIAVKAYQFGSHTEALLIPLRTGGFTVLVDGVPCQTEISKGTLRRWRRFLIAHEIAHTAFYEPGFPPKRIVRHTKAEEEFCDAVAGHLLLPDYELKGVRLANDVFHVGHRLDITLQVVLNRLVGQRCGVQAAIVDMRNNNVRRWGVVERTSSGHDPLSRQLRNRWFKRAIQSGAPRANWNDLSGEEHYRVSFAQRAGTAVVLLEHR